MKKSTIFMTAGAFILAIAGVLATKANKKFNAVSTAKLGSSFIGISTATNIAVSNYSSNFTSTYSSGVTFTAYLGLYTKGGAILSGQVLVTNATGADKVYYF